MAYQSAFRCREPKSAAPHKDYSCGVFIISVCRCCFDYFPPLLLSNSGFLHTLEPGVSAVYLCRRVHSTACSVSLDGRLQGELDGAKVNYFLTFISDAIFHVEQGKHRNQCSC